MRYENASGAPPEPQDRTDEAHIRQLAFVRGSPAQKHESVDRHDSSESQTVRGDLEAKVRAGWGSPERGIYEVKKKKKKKKLVLDTITRRAADGTPD